MTTTAWTGDTVSSASYTTILQDYFLLLETGDYLLQEDSEKVLLESSIRALYTDVSASSSSWTPISSGSAVWT